MFGIGARRQLADALGSLAGYNDKGCDWSGHSPERQDAHRAESMLEIRRLIASIGPHKLPPDLIAAVESGELALDASGKYAEML